MLHCRVEELIKNMILRREELNWTKTKLAKQLEVSVSTIVNWETGSVFPSLNNQIKIMKYLVEEDRDAWAKRLLSNTGKSSFDSYKEKVEELYSFVTPLAEALTLSAAYIDHKEEIKLGNRTVEVEISDLVISNMSKSIYLRFNCLSGEDHSMIFLSTRNSAAELTSNKNSIFLISEKDRSWVVQSGSSDLIDVDENFFMIVLEEVFFG